MLNTALVALVAMFAMIFMVFLYKMLFHRGVTV